MVAGLVLAAMAAGVAGCANSPRRPAAARPQPLQWRVDALRGQLPAVLLVRGRQLCVERLDSATATPIWTAPAETTPTILAVDQPGGRIAVLLRAAPTVTFEPVGHALHPPEWSDAGIVVLSADGSAGRLTVNAQTRPIHLGVQTLRQKGSLTISSGPDGSLHPDSRAQLRSIDASIPDVVTSGAFLGPDLALTTESGAAYRSGQVRGTPLLLTARGRTLVLSDAASATLEPVDQFCQLAAGGVLAVRAGDRFFASPTQHNASLVGLRGSTLVTSSPTYSVGYQRLGPVASADGTAAFMYLYTWKTARLIVTSLETTGWQTQPTELASAFGLSRLSDFGGGYDVDLPQPGPGGRVLAPVRQTGGGHLIGPPPATIPTSDLRVIRTDASQPGNTATPVEVEQEDDFLTRTWTYVARFGSAH